MGILSEVFRKNSYFKLISIVLYVVGGLNIILSGVALGLSLAAHAIFGYSYYDNNDGVDEIFGRYDLQLPIGGLITAVGALITAGMISGLLSCGATERQMSKFLYPVLVLAVELALMGLAIDLHFLVLTGFGTVQYSLQSNIDDIDQSLLHYAKVTIGITGTSTWLVVTTLIGMCVTTYNAGKHLKESVRNNRPEDSEDQDVALLGSDQRRPDRIEMRTMKKVELLALCVTGTLFGIISLALSLSADGYGLFSVGFVWLLPTWPVCILLWNSRRCCRQETWEITCYACGIISSLMTITGFIYEIISTAATTDHACHDSTVLCIAYIGSQIYVVASLLGTFILSIIVCVKLQPRIWKSCLINSDESDCEVEDRDNNIGIEQAPQISLRSNDIGIARNDPIATESTFNGTPGNVIEDETTEESDNEPTVHTNIYSGAPFLDQ